jgi:ribosome maturation factor RimP
MNVERPVRELAEPIVARLGLELFDIEHAGGILRVTVERPGGVDLESIAAVTRELSRALDEHDPIAGRYTLEVSSPGLERTLRSPEHFAWAVGKDVSVKTVATYEGERRLSGTVRDADDEGVTLVPTDLGRDAVRLRYDDIDKARTTFEWGGQPKPGRDHRSNTTRRARAS